MNAIPSDIVNRQKVHVILLSSAAAAAALTPLAKIVVQLVAAPVNPSILTYVNT